MGEDKFNFQTRRCDYERCYSRLFGRHNGRARAHLH